MLPSWFLTSDRDGVQNNEISNNHSTCGNFMHNGFTFLLVLWPQVTTQCSSCEDKNACSWFKVGSNVQWFAERISIHPLSITTYPLYAGPRRELEPIPAYTGRKVGYALWGTPWWGTPWWGTPWTRPQFIVGLFRLGLGLAIVHAVIIKQQKRLHNRRVDRLLGSWVFTVYSI